MAALNLVHRASEPPPPLPGPDRVKTFSLFLSYFILFIDLILVVLQEGQKQARLVEKDRSRGLGHQHVIFSIL